MLKISSGRRHMGAVPIEPPVSPPPLRGRFVTVLPLRRPCILSYCRSDGCMSTTWSLRTCAMLKISSGRRHMGAVPIEPPVSPPPLRGRFVTVLPLRRPCILSYCRSDGCMSTTWSLRTCAMLKISSGRRHMGAVPIEPPVSPPPLRGRFVTVLPLRRPCILSYCRSDGCMSTTWSLRTCAMLKISSGRRHMGAVPIEPPVSPPPLRGRFVTVLPLRRPCILSLENLNVHFDS